MAAILLVVVSIFLLMTTVDAIDDNPYQYSWDCEGGNGGVDEATAAATMRAILVDMVATVPYRNGQSYCNVVESRVFGFGYCLFTAIGRIGHGGAGDEVAAACRGCMNDAAAVLYGRCSASGAGRVGSPLHTNEYCYIEISTRECHN